MSNPRQRATTGKQPETPVSDAKVDAAKAPPLQRQRSLSQRAISQTLTGTANLAKHLPTGTLLAFQLLVPVFTQNGVCDSVTRPLTLGLLVLLSLSCFLACFTDTIKVDKQVYHGFATFKGFKLFDCPDPSGPGLDPKKLESYKIGFIDYVHAVLSVLMFGAVAFRDRNVVSCLYPAPAHETQEVLDIVPVGVGLICSLLFVIFPSRRNGIGYPVTGDADDKDE